MKSKKITIINPTGFHTRPARHFVDTANDNFPDTDVRIIKGEKTINGKSVIHMLTLGVKYQEEIELVVEGGPEEEALEALGRYFETIYKE
ncbi:MAG: HPr family phosphocarrier protein [Spirochaetes bacterium]|nr:HPr family phosphocarrier protein [Spirochaetota bacterium]MBU0955176.1 HPr family phosphocarrier protein [Spirochaetota bacterium]